MWRRFTELALALCLVSCASRPPPDRPPPADIPRARIEIGAMTQYGLLGTFCWKGWCRDARLISPEQTLEVPQSFEFALTFVTRLNLRDVELNVIPVDDSMILDRTDDGVVVWNPPKWGEQRRLSPQRTQNVPMTLPVGQYIIFVGSWWVGGNDASFSFRLVVSPNKSF
jgi:hypothetical protein